MEKETTTEQSAPAPKTLSAKQEALHKRLAEIEDAIPESMKKDHLLAAGLCAGVVVENAMDDLIRTTSPFTVSGALRNVARGAQYAAGGLVAAGVVYGAARLISRNSENTQADADGQATENDPFSSTEPSASARPNLKRA